MAFNRFNGTVLFLILLIAFTGTGVIWVWSYPEFRVAKFSFAVVWILEIAFLLRYVNKTNRQLKLFLERINYSDFIRSDLDSGKSFRELNLTYNEIIRYIKLAQLEKASTNEYLRSIVDFVPVGILSVNRTGKVEMVNQACLNLFGISELKQIKDLNQLNVGLGDKLMNLKEEQMLVDFEGLQKHGRLLVRVHTKRIADRELKLYSIQTIQSELEKEEASAWKKIFRVLTHEIMNSVGPIRSLTNSILQIFQENERAKPLASLNDEDIELTVSGLRSIDNRNKGLSKFVSDFKSLSRIPAPDLKKQNLKHFFSALKPVLMELFPVRSQEIDMESPNADIYLSFDEKQLAQVLINLVKNASEATRNCPEPKVRLRVQKIEAHIYIIVEDNGSGISSEIKDQIFIPFFTTKNNGSGIGLALSRQLIWNHGGKLYFETREDGTSFVLELKLT